MPRLAEPDPSMPAIFSTVYVRFLLLAICLVVLRSGQVLAQPDAPDFEDFGGSGFGEIDFGGNQSAGEDGVVTLEARFSEASEEGPAMVQITATIGGDYHIYAIDQGALPDGGGPNPTVVTVEENESFRLLGPLQALTDPEIHFNDDAWEGLALREHYKRAVWYAPSSGQKVSIRRVKTSREASVFRLARKIAVCHQRREPLPLNLVASSLYQYRTKHRPLQTQARPTCR